MTNLAGRLQDIPGIESVVVDLDDSGILVRLEEGVDGSKVMDRVRALLVAYGVRPEGSPPVRIGRSTADSGLDQLDVDVRITPIKGGARVEVLGKTVRSFRIVPPNPTAIAQGVSDAWCQVLGRIPVEIIEVSVGDTGKLKVVASDGGTQKVGTADVGDAADGWVTAITRAVGEATGLLSNDEQPGGKRLASAGR